MKTVFSIIGQRYGRLLVVGALIANRRGFAACSCDCGTLKLIPAGGLKSGAVRSCGCSLLKHGHTRRLRSAGHPRVSPEWGCWSGMRTRCTNRRSKSWARYGGRGIRVCERWGSFENFLVDMGPKPTPQHSIDRIDNEGHYEPGNCRWSLGKEQRDNRRVSRWLEARGQRHTVTDWSELTGVSRSAIRARLGLGWSVERAIFEPVSESHQQRGKPKKLACADVVAIRLRAGLGESKRGLAVEFGVSESAIKQIVLRRVWKSVA